MEPPWACRIGAPTGEAAGVWLHFGSPRTQGDEGVRAVALGPCAGVAKNGHSHSHEVQSVQATQVSHKKPKKRQMHPKSAKRAAPGPFP
jgi:hypothetical protein